jgi:pimeloyl-ACP methyl ester carboxylesterase
MGAARFIRGRGARTVVLIGASMGGEASIIAASKLGSEVDGLISLSASEGYVAPLDLGVAHRTVAAIVAPKLFVAGKFDREFAGYAADYFSHARPPKSKRIFDSGDHGIALLKGEQGDTVRALVLDFLSSSR